MVWFALFAWRLVANVTLGVHKPAVGAVRIIIALPSCAHLGNLALVAVHTRAKGTANSEWAIIFIVAAALAAATLTIPHGVTLKARQLGAVRTAWDRRAVFLFTECITTLLVAAFARQLWVWVAMFI